MIAADLLEKHGKPTLVITLAVVGATWVAGYWHSWSDLNFKLIYLLFGVVILTVALLRLIGRLLKKMFSAFAGSDITQPPSPPQ